MNCDKSNFEGDGYNAQSCFLGGMETEKGLWIKAIDELAHKMKGKDEQLISLYNEIGDNFSATSEYKNCMDPRPDSVSTTMVVSFFKKQVTHYSGKDNTKSLSYECKEMGEIAEDNRWIKTLNLALKRSIINKKAGEEIISKVNQMKNLLRPRISPVPVTEPEPAPATAPVSPAVSPPTVSDRRKFFEGVAVNERRVGSKVTLPPTGTHRGGGRKKSKRRKNTKKKHRSSNKKRRKSKTKRRR
jgi:hypothetical protein